VIQQRQQLSIDHSEIRQDGTYINLSVIPVRDGGIRRDRWNALGEDEIFECEIKLRLKKPEEMLQTR
jgi:hypothetical protein